VYIKAKKWGGGPLLLSLRGMAKRTSRWMVGPRYAGAKDGKEEAREALGRESKRHS